MVASISLAKFRQDAEEVLRRVKQGERFVLTYRGDPIARLSPYTTTSDIDDPIYRLADISLDQDDALSNEEMDAVVYGA